MESLSTILTLLNTMIVSGPKNLADKANVAKASLTRIVVNLGSLQDMTTNLYWLFKNADSGVRESGKEQEMDGLTGIEDMLELLAKLGPKNVADKAVEVKAKLSRIGADLDSLWELTNTMYWLAVYTSQGTWKSHTEALYLFTAEILSILKKYGVAEEGVISEESYEEGGYE